MQEYGRARRRAAIRRPRADRLQSARRCWTRASSGLPCCPSCSFSSSSPSRSRIARGRCARRSPRDAFDGARAAQLLDDLARRYPVARAGSPGDDGARARRGGELRAALPQVDVACARSFAGETLDGDRNLRDRHRAGARQHAALAGRARRAARRRRAAGDRADLSGTAALIEIARVVGTSRLARTVTFASVSGASGGQAGMRDLVQRSCRGRSTP